MKREEKNKKLMLILLALLLLISFLVISVIKDNRNSNQEYSIADFSYKGKDYNKKEDIELLLFAGLDTYDRYVKDPYKNEYSADCLVLFVLDNKNKTILPIQINKDTMCSYSMFGNGGRIVDEVYGQIHLAHTYGSGSLDSLVNVKKAVSEIFTGILIDDYFSMSMDAVPIINDSVNGVDIYVSENFASVDPTIVQNKVNHLTGYHALTYVKTKDGVDNSSNISRMTRQSIYFNAIFAKAKKLIETDNKLVANTFNSINEYIAVNTDIYGLIDLTNTFLGYELLDTKYLEGEEKIKENGETEFIVDQEKVIDFCINNLYDEVK